MKTVAVVLLVLVLALACVLLDYHFGFVPITDSPGAWRRAASSLQGARSSQEEADCFRMSRKLHHVQVRMFNKGGQEISPRSQPLDWNSIHTVEIQWREHLARHDLIDTSNLSILMGE